MKHANTKTPAESPSSQNPYTPREAKQPKNALVRAGMSVAEMVMWLVVMAVLSVCMIVMLWHASK